MIKKLANAVVEKIIQEAKDEVNKEVLEKAKKEMKERLRELSRANKLVANIEREIEDLELKLQQELR